MKNMIHITLKDGVVKDFEAPVTPMQIAKSIGEGLYKAVCVAKIDGVVRDLRTPIELRRAWLRCPRRIWPRQPYCRIVRACRLAGCEGAGADCPSVYPKALP